MQVLTCPDCSAPVPIPSPRAVPRVEELSCSYCGARNELSEAERRELQAVSLRVWANEQSEQALAKQQTEALLNAGRLRRKLFSLLVLASLPWLCLGSIPLAAGELPADAGEAGVVLALVVLPVALMAALVVLTVRWLGRRREKLLSACSARPPTVPGEPAHCRFCRAPLLAKGSEGVVRCEHCATDNVVSVSIAQRARVKHKRATSELRRHLTLSSEDLEKGIRRMRWRVYLSALLIPFATVAVLFVVLFITFLFESPADPNRQYAIVKTSEGACIGWIHGEGEAALLDFGTEDPGGITEPAPLKEFEILERVTIGELIGREVRVDGKVGRIARAFSTPVYTNWIEVEFADGDWSNSAHGTCLARQDSDSP